MSGRDFFEIVSEAQSTCSDRIAGEKSDIKPDEGVNLG